MISGLSTLMTWVKKYVPHVDARSDPDFTIIVRTDALAVTGWQDTMRRCEAYVEAGADVLFVEALRSTEEAERAANSIDVPLLYNFVEGGKSPLIPAAQLEQLGFKLVIFPASAMLTVCRVVTDLMQELKEQGTTSRLLDNMVGLEECLNIVGLDEMLSRDAAYATEPQPAG